MEKKQKFKTSNALGLMEDQLFVTKVKTKTSVKFNLNNLNNKTLKVGYIKRKSTSHSLKVKEEIHKKFVKKFTTTKFLINPNQLDQTISSSSVLSVNELVSTVSIDKSIVEFKESNNELTKGFSVLSVASEYNLIKKVADDLEKLLDEALSNYYIDSIYNQPETYEDYLIQNLKVINRMQYEFNKNSYDVKFNNLIKKLKENKIIDQLDYDKPYLFIDLDETLIHSEMFYEEKAEQYDKVIEVNYLSDIDDKEHIDKIGVYIRPNCLEFLTWVKEYFRLILFTAAEAEYVDKVLTACRITEFFDMILDREYTIQVKDFKIKDLSIFNIESKLNCLILDNNIYSFACSLPQGILISSFLSDKEDDELFGIIEYLKSRIIENLDNMVEINSCFYMYQDIMTSIDFNAKVEEEDL